jgi:hygromycin-B 7''-O-kinase
MGQVPLQNRLRAARELGDTVRRIHALPLQGSPVFPNSHAPYLRFLEQQRAGVVERQRAWGSLPSHLLAGIDEFIPPPEALVDRTRSPHLIHADLTRDHLLGRLENGRWTNLAIIDFGDAMTGSLLYELCALHLDLFGSDKRLLAAFLEAYDMSTLSPRIALATVLLHQFNMFAALPEEMLEVETLEELAERLYGV